MATHQRGAFLPGSAIMPDGSASNAAPGRRTVKSSASAPGRYFLELVFDASTEQWCCFSDRMPGNYVGTPVAKLIYKMTSATTGNVVWDVRIGATTPGDAVDEDAQDYGSANTTTSAVPGTAGHTKSETVTLSAADGLAASDLYSIRVARAAANASDTATGNAELLEVVLEYSDA